MFSETPKAGLPEAFLTISESEKNAKDIVIATKITCRLILEVSTFLQDLGKAKGLSLIHI